MFGRSHGSKNSATSGGGALTSHLFHLRLLPRPTCSAAAADNPRKTTDVPTSTSATIPTGHDGRSQVVQLVAVRRRNTEEPVRRVSTEVNSTDPRGRRRRSRLGLSLAVVRGPSSMMSGNTSSTLSSVDVVSDPSRDDNDEHRLRHNSAAADTSTSLTSSSHAASDVQRLKETAGDSGEYGE